jgi:very-short-patch-repair endonuclease/predicted transcriptional regulator of viral defense system
MDGQSREDAPIAALAARQHGVVTRSQLRRLGLGRGAVEHRLDAGRLIRVHRGVYAVGHLPRTRHASWMAAVLACGDRALLSHCSAAALWGVRAWAPARPEVTTRAQRSRPGITVHVRRTAPEERAVHQGIPVTSLARTIVDLAHTLDVDELERVVRETDFQRRLDVAAVRQSLVRRPSRDLVDLLDRRAPTQSRHEDRFLRLCRRFGLPVPLTQQSVGGRTVDFLWPDARLVVEIDSWDAHGTRTAFQNDRAATNAMQLSGYVVLRFTDGELRRDPARVARLVGRALAAQLTVPPVR